jgi:hypothetical protein
MKLTQRSKKYMDFFMNNGNKISHTKISPSAKRVINELFNDLVNAYKYIQYQKKHTNIFSNVEIKYLETIKQIPKPNTFNSNSFSLEVITHIDRYSSFQISYTFSLFGRNIKVHFILEEQELGLNINRFNQYIETIAIWLSILNKYSMKKCSETLIIYIYFTKLKKEIPESNFYTLDQNNVNTAFTYSCPKDSEIVIYRREEWLKVLIHETFHSFGLDFSDEINLSKKCNEEILNLFPVKSEVSSYEAYTEFFAEIMNAALTSFYINKNKYDFDSFLSTFEILLYFERMYSFFQLVKVLDFMGLKYSDLYSSSNRSLILRETMYKEKTNVLSYYIIKTLLLNNYGDFLVWCHNNNDSLLQFKKTNKNIDSFCKFIKDNYKTKSMTSSVKETEKIFYNINHKRDELVRNLRMTMIELG